MRDLHSAVKSEVVIRPRRKLLLNDFRDIWSYRDLVIMFFVRDFSTVYKQTILGPIWYLLQPLVTSITYFVVFSKIANISTDNTPPLLFYLSGISIWSYFSLCLINTSDTFFKNSSLFGKVYFPRVVVPISIAIGGLISQCIQLVLLIAAGVLTSITDGKFAIHLEGILILPLIAGYVALLGVGMGMIVSAATVRYRDLAYATGFLTQLWMYATPVVYPLSQVPAAFRPIFFFNPMTAPIETYRAAMLGTTGAPLLLWLSNCTLTAILALLGLVLFTKAEAIAMDTV